MLPDFEPRRNFFLKDPPADGSVTFQWMAKKGHVDVVRLLLEDDRVDPSDNGNAAIINASEHGHVEVVRLWLEDDRVDQSHGTEHAVLAACLEESVDVMCFLLKKSGVNFANKFIFEKVSLGIKRKFALITVLSPIFHLVAAVIAVAFRTLKLISFAHFWWPGGGSFQARIKEFGMDIVKIVAQPLANIALLSLAIFGIFSPWKAGNFSKS